jgi:transcriptional regulator with XRE-family HTH domain
MKKKPFMTLEQMLAKRRLRCDITQAKVATELGFTSPQYISNMERGLTKLPEKHFRKVSQLLGVPLREMVDHRSRDMRHDLIRRVRIS